MWSNLEEQNSPRITIAPPLLNILSSLPSSVSQSHAPSASCLADISSVSLQLPPPPLPSISPNSQPPLPLVSTFELSPIISASRDVLTPNETVDQLATLGGIGQADCDTINAGGFGGGSAGSGNSNGSVGSYDNGKSSYSLGGYRPTGRWNHGTTKSGDQFSCRQCGHTYRQKVHLRKHVMSAHWLRKPYQCQHCAYATVEKSHLTVHVRTHTGERPFRCRECGYASAQNCTLKSHYLRRHPASRVLCGWCGDTFVTEQERNNHQRSCQDGLDVGLDRAPTLVSSGSLPSSSSTSFPVASDNEHSFQLALGNSGLEAEKSLAPSGDNESTTVALGFNFASSTSSPRVPGGFQATHFSLRSIPTPPTTVWKPHCSLNAHV
ncbi:unnamed protein product [Protopolystoma xenopodis]|uniref:C2H2-type domain-containing protein n=1 Tax=Protopolystoma xenopodis TaxID=117903 RepID=A0A448WAC5_9PLAT|nr:unnamed protein product [Protopolystoma xenopodis]